MELTGLSLGQMVQRYFHETQRQAKQNCPYWNTYNGWAKMGFQVVDKAYGAYVHKTFPKYEEDKETGEKTEKISHFASNCEAVFNGASVKQATFKEIKTKKGYIKLIGGKIIENAKTYAELNPVKPQRKMSGAKIIGRVETYIANTSADIRHGSNGAFFSPSEDFISMPTRESFKDTESYYATLLHELTHWTGHKSRLDRIKSTRFGDKLYSEEELVAELGSAFLCNALGISATPRADHAKYLNGWIRGMKDNERAIIFASRQAQKAFELLEDLQPENQLEEAA
jgi:antirestriction protein ArdC